MPASICGNWEMVSNANMEGYMIALGKFPACYTCIEDFCMMHCQKKQNMIIQRFYSGMVTHIAQVKQYLSRY